MAVSAAELTGWSGSSETCVAAAAAPDTLRTHGPGSPQYVASDSDDIAAVIACVEPLDGDGGGASGRCSPTATPRPFTGACVAGSPARTPRLPEAIQDRRAAIAQAKVARRPRGTSRPSPMRAVPSRWGSGPGQPGLCAAALRTRRLQAALGASIREARGRPVERPPSPA